jgi:transcriptional regulatory protein GAL4
LPEDTPLASENGHGNGEKKTNEPQDSGKPATNFDLLKNLATSAILDRLIDAYFQLYNSAFPILHERTFRERFQIRQRSPAKASWKITMYMVLALGHWMTASEKEHGRSPYYSAARSLFTIQMLESGTLGTVQACLMMVRSLS